MHIWNLVWSKLILHSPVCSERTGKAAGPCSPSELNPGHGRLQTRTLAPARPPPAGLPFPWRCSQIYPNRDPNPSQNRPHQGAPLCRAELDLYLSPSQCLVRTTVSQKPLFRLFTTQFRRQPRRVAMKCEKCDKDKSSQSISCTTNKMYTGRFQIQYVIFDNPL